MFSLKYFTDYIKPWNAHKAIRCFSTKYADVTPKTNFETVFSLPYVKYLALFNKLKVYQIVGTSVTIPSCAVLESMNYVPQQTFLSAAYLGVTAAAVLAIASIPTSNIIGFLYISEDNSQIKISVLDFWGNRKDRIVPAEEWIRLYDMEPKYSDPLYLSPQLVDGTKYKLLIKFGKVVNEHKIAAVLE